MGGVWGRGGMWEECGVEVVRSIRFLLYRPLGCGFASNYSNMYVR